MFLSTHVVSNHSQPGRVRMAGPALARRKHVRTLTWSIEMLSALAMTTVRRPAGRIGLDPPRLCIASDDPGQRIMVKLQLTVGERTMAARLFISPERLL
jgi:hypothetical protein